MAWTRERLEDVARTRLAGARLIIVANREPYIHRYQDGEVEWIRPAGGLTTALDPVMRACGGTWVALSMTISFLTAAPPGARLIAEARERRQGRQAGFYEVTVSADGATVATVHCVAHRVREPDR